MSGYSGIEKTEEGHKTSARQISARDFIQFAMSMVGPSPRFPISTAAAKSEDIIYTHNAQQMQITLQRCSLGKHQVLAARGFCGYGIRFKIQSV